MRVLICFLVLLGAVNFSHARERKLVPIESTIGMGDYIINDFKRPSDDDKLKGHDGGNGGDSARLKFSLAIGTALKVIDEELEVEFFSPKVRDRIENIINLRNVVVVRNASRYITSFGANGRVFLNGNYWDEKVENPLGMASEALRAVLEALGYLGSDEYYNYSGRSPFANYTIRGDLGQERVAVVLAGAINRSYPQEIERTSMKLIQKVEETGLFPGLDFDHIKSFISSRRFISQDEKLFDIDGQVVKAKTIPGKLIFFHKYKWEHYFLQEEVIATGCTETLLNEKCRIDSILLFHELLRLSGFDDENYKISKRLNQL